MTRPPASQQKLDRTLDEVHCAILPTAAQLLEALIDAAASARPGVDAAVYADEIRRLSEQARRAADEIAEIVLSVELPPAAVPQDRAQQG